MGPGNPAKGSAGDFVFTTPVNTGTTARSRAAERSAKKGQEIRKRNISNRNIKNAEVHSVYTGRVQKPVQGRKADLTPASKASSSRAGGRRTNSKPLDPGTLPHKKVEAAVTRTKATTRASMAKSSHKPSKSKAGETSGKVADTRTSCSAQGVKKVSSRGEKDAGSGKEKRSTSRSRASVSAPQTPKKKLGHTKTLATPPKSQGSAVKKDTRHSRHILTKSPTRTKSGPTPAPDKSLGPEKTSKPRNVVSAQLKNARTTPSKAKPATGASTSKAASKQGQSSAKKTTVHAAIVTLPKRKRVLSTRMDESKKAEVARTLAADSRKRQAAQKLKASSSKKPRPSTSKAGTDSHPGTVPRSQAHKDMISKATRAQYKAGYHKQKRARMDKPTSKRLDALPGTFVDFWHTKTVRYMVKTEVMGPDRMQLNKALGPFSVLAEANNCCDVEAKQYLSVISDLDMPRHDSSYATQPSADSSGMISYHGELPKRKLLSLGTVMQVRPNGGCFSYVVNTAEYEVEAGSGEVVLINQDVHSVHGLLPAAKAAADGIAPAGKWVEFNTKDGSESLVRRAQLSSNGLSLSVVKVTKEADWVQWGPELFASQTRRYSNRPSMSRALRNGAHDSTHETL